MQDAGPLTPAPVQAPITHVVVKRLTDGPFKGRVYARHPFTGQWKRVKHLERATPHAKADQEAKLRQMVASIPDQAALDAILAKEPDEATRAALLDQWRPWLSFCPTNDWSADTGEGQEVP